MKMNTVQRKTLLAASIAAVIASTGATTSLAAEEETHILEEVIVSATKRAESLQDVGMSVSALSKDNLEKMGASDFDSYLPMLTGVNFNDDGGSNKKLVLRGVSDGMGRDVQTQSTVAVYINDTPFSNANNGFPDSQMFDIEQVELLRGPQGTLYGSASLGGTLRIITSKANPEKFEAKVETTYSSTKNGEDSYAVNAMVNLPISDNVAARLVGYTRTDGGFIDQVQLGIDDWNETKVDGLRASLLVNATDNFSVDLTTIIQQTDADGRARHMPAMGDLKLDGPIAETRESDFTLVGLTMRYDLGWAELFSSSSYNEADGVSLIDFSDVAYSLIQAIYLGFGATDTYGALGQTRSETASAWHEWRTTETYVQEIRLTSQTEGNLDWIIGGFYSTEDQGQKQRSVYEQLSEGLAPVGFSAFVQEGGLLYLGENYVFVDDATYEFDQAAIFGEINYHISDTMRLTVGARWSDNDYELTGTSAGMLNVIQGRASFDEMFAGTKGRVDNSVKYSQNSIIPKFAFEYDLNEDTLLYALVTKGHRIGGGNTAFAVASGAPSTYDSDELNNYEAGWKATVLDGRATFNGSLFYMEYSDIQSTFTTDSSFGYKDNAGEASITGLELETSFQLTESLLINAGAALMDPKLEKDFISPRTGTIGGKKGDQLIMAPKYSYNISLQYNTELAASLNLNARLDYSYIGKSYQQFESFAADWTEVGDTERLNTRVSVASSDGWEADLFINNLLDERARLHVFSYDVEDIAVNRPRTAGMTLRYNF
jgi:iron complex outermembrane receptor protein